MCWLRRINLADRVSGVKGCGGSEVEKEGARKISGGN